MFGLFVCINYFFVPQSRLKRFLQSGKMFATFVCRNPVAVNITKSALTKGAIFSKLNGPSNITVRQMAGPVRSGMTRRAPRSRSLKEIVMAPAGDGGL